MSIKSQGGVFGRNPTFNDVTVDGDLSIAGTLSVGGETITGLSYQGGWNASTNTPDIAASSPVTGQFWIVSADGSTDVGGITNWTQGDWALYDGSNWQRVEGGNTDLSTGVQGQLAVANGGTGAADAATARTNLGLAIGTDVEAVDATILRSAAIGVTVQGYDADTAKYDDTTANFTGTLQNGGSNVVVDSDIGSTVQAYDANILTSSDIGSTVQAYDADTTKNDVANTFTQNQIINGNLGVGGSGTNTVSSGVAVNNATAGNYPGYEIQTAGTTRFYINANNAASYITSVGTSPMVFLVNSGEAARFNSSGNLAFPSGQGIDFSATSGTGTSELLDDYEEGTWTPTISAQTVGNLSVTYNVRNGTYTKVGRMVTASCRITTTAFTHSTAANDFYITGLPFNARTFTNMITIGSAFVYGANKTGFTQLNSRIDSGSSTMLFQASGPAGASTSSLKITEVTSGSTPFVYATIVYEAA